MATINLLARLCVCAFGTLGLSVMVGACHRSAPVATPPEPEVKVVTARRTPISMSTELPGRTSAFLVAQVRARVDGIVLKREFTEGGDVRVNQRLYQIDPMPYRAALQSAEAALARARASFESARAQVERDEVLVAANAISRQRYVNDLAAQGEAAADVEAAIAAVELARINLGYTDVVSPIDGRIGASVVTPGAYVQASEATLLSTIQQIDPVYVDLSQTSVEGLQLRQLIASGRLQAGGAGTTEVRLILEDGSHYPRVGTLEFNGITVDEGTGTILVRAIFPNPDHVLLPGMFVRAVLDHGIDVDAMLLPEQGVTHDRTGRATVLVVDADNKVAQRTVVASRLFEQQWVVDSGLEEGERVIVLGTQRVQPGMVVKPVAYKQSGSPPPPAARPQVAQRAQ